MRRRQLLNDPSRAILVGANYWGSKAAHRMWEKWDPVSIEKDLVLARDIGLNSLRIFFWSPELNPLPGVVNEQVLSRFDEFLSLCEKQSIGVFPTIFVGHMSGTNWDIPWRQGRDFCADPYMVYWEADLVRRLVGRYRGHRAILGWILSNELPNYTGSLPPETATTWMRAMYQAVKEADPAALVSPGDGARCEARPDYDGFRVEWIHRHVDWLGVHLYNYFLSGDTDDLRNSYHIPCRLRYVDVGEKPVLLEEFGLSDLISGREEAAGYYRSVLYSSLLNGSCGALAWCLTDFDLPGEVPYSFQPHELKFGVADSQRRLKPQGEVLQAFARFVRERKIERYQSAPPAEAIYVPYAMYQDRSFHKSFDRLRAYRALEQGFTLAKMAALNPDFVRSVDELDRYRTLFMVGGARLESSEWLALREWVEKGGTLYYSYMGLVGGVYAPNFEELFGIRHRLRYGQLEEPEEPSVRLTFSRSFGHLAERDTIEIPRGPVSHESAYLPVEPTQAQTLAIDGRGRPALLSYDIGKGHAVFFAYPLEYALLNTPDANLSTHAHEIYAAVAESAGAPPRFTGKHPWLEAGVLDEEGGSGHLLILVNHAHRGVAGAMKDRTSGGEVAYDLPMKGVAIYELRAGRWEAISSRVAAS